MKWPDMHVPLLGTIDFKGLSLISRLGSGYLILVRFVHLNSLRKSLIDISWGKLMKTRPTIIKRICTIFGHSSVLFGALLSVCCVASDFEDKGSDTYNKVKLLQALNVLAKAKGRSISSFVPSDEIGPTPVRQTEWLESVFVHDRAGVLHSIRDQFDSWDKIEAFSDNWHLESTGLYETPSETYKRSFMQKNMLKYFDKRLSGEIKNSAEGSTLYRVGQVQQVLKPSTKFSITNDIKVRLKAKVLQGKIFLLVENPYIECKTEFNAKGELLLDMGKKFKATNTEANFNYKVNEGSWIASLDQALVKDWRARVSSELRENKDTQAFEEGQTFQLLYSHNF